MGGRGSAGGTRSTYRGDSTRLFKEGQAQAAADLLLKKKKKQATASKSSGGGGGGSSSSGSKKPAGAGTGGVQGGQGGSGGSSGGGSTAPKQDTKDTNDQMLPPDADLELEFERSQAFKDFNKKYTGGVSSSEKGYERAYNKAYSDWLQTVQVAPDDMGPKPGPSATALTPQIGASVETDLKKKYQNMYNRLPERLRKIQKERGTRIYVVKRAGDHPDYAETGYGDAKIGDGRTVGDISFYSPNTKQIFISTDYDQEDGGSRNVMIHESAHDLDANYLTETQYLSWEDEDGTQHEAWIDVISQDDPNWIYMHDTYIRNSETADDYYRGGHDGTAEEGRSETFAEAMAVWFEGGIVGLRGFFAEAIPDRDDRNEAIDQILSVWRRYGIID